MTCQTILNNSLDLLFLLIKVILTLHQQIDSPDHWSRSPCQIIIIYLKETLFLIQTLRISVVHSRNIFNIPPQEVLVKSKDMFYVETNNSLKVLFTISGNLYLFPRHQILDMFSQNFQEIEMSIKILNTWSTPFHLTGSTRNKKGGEQLLTSQSVILQTRENFTRESLKRCPSSRVKLGLKMRLSISKRQGGHFLWRGSGGESSACQLILI